MFEKDILTGDSCRPLVPKRRHFKIKKEKGNCCFLHCSFPSRHIRVEPPGFVFRRPLMDQPGWFDDGLLISSIQGPHRLQSTRVPLHISYPCIFLWGAHVGATHVKHISLLFFNIIHLPNLFHLNDFIFYFETFQVHRKSR